MSAAHHLAASLAAVSPMDPAWWLGSLGLAGIFAVLLAETATPAGFVLPGDSLLLAAGAMCVAPPGGQARLSLPLVILAAFGGTACGAQGGYLLGRRAGRAVRASARASAQGNGGRGSGGRGDGGRFRRVAAAAERGERLLARLGIGRALLLARFIPVVRTVISPLCGAAGVPVRRFLAWQLAGAAVWTAGTTTAGYLAARALPGLTRYLMPVIALITAVSVVAAAVSAVRARRRNRGASPGHHPQPQPGDTVRSGELRRPPHLAGTATNREVL